MSIALECTGFLMCCIGWLMTGISLANHYWKTSMLPGITSVWQFQNLWQSCTENHNSISRCQNLDMLLPLPVHVVVCRILMIVSLLLGLSTMWLPVLCHKCIRISLATEQMTVTWGIFCLLGGLCCMTAVSWYAYRVVEDNNLVFKFELGVGLYLGWAGACFSIMGGGMLCSHCRRAGNKKLGFRGNQPATIYTRADGSTQETDMSHV